MDTNSPKPRLNLVVNLTGAVSAGTYAAGVLDFLIEALDEFYAARERDDDTPIHDVVLTGLSGASAGAQTALILASSIAYRFAPMRHESIAAAHSSGPARGARNPFFHHWVEMNDLHDYLTTRDRPVQSVLDSTNIDLVVRSVLDFGTGLVRTCRPWVANHLRLGIAMTNLRGMPTSYANQPAAGDHEFTRHADSMYFSISGLGSASTPAPKGVEHPLAMPESAADKCCAWYETLGRACVASGAFPLVFKPRTLERPTSDYRAPGSHALPPSESTYAFCALDGGVFNNNPQDIAARLREESGSSPTIVLTIGSAPSRAADGPTNADSLSIAGSGGALLSAIWNEARFRPDALTFRDEPGDYANFLLFPSGASIGARAAQRGDDALYGSGLGGFAGYFAVDFREHDFMLGRRNARAALGDYLCLPEKHSLFNHWTEDQRKRYRVVNPVTKVSELPIIPLSPALARSVSDIEVEALPLVAAPDVEGYRSPIRRRLRHVVRGLPSPGSSAVLFALCWVAAWPVAWWISRRLMKLIQKDRFLSEGVGETVRS